MLRNGLVNASTHMDNIEKHTAELQTLIDQSSTNTDQQTLIPV